MVRAVRHPDGAAFLRRATEFLVRAEAENNIIMGVAGLGASVGTNDAYFATAEEGAAVVGCAIRTPPNKALISRSSPDALRVLADDMRARYERLPAVLGPDPSVRQFAEIWTERTGRAPVQGMRQRLFATSRVAPLDQRPSGAIRGATHEDVELLTRWMESFIQEVALDHQPDPRQMARARIANQSVFIWDDGDPVSMAGWAGRTLRGVRVNFVYTPPNRRGRGYASACVADLTQRLLQEGTGFCCLVTDLANPTSNSIYQRIGYRPVCDMSDFILDHSS